VQQFFEAEGIADRDACERSGGPPVSFRRLLRARPGAATLAIADRTALRLFRLRLKADNEALFQ
jgi:hypothetical protein